MGIELLQSQVCRSQGELITTQEQWHAAMLEKGWGTSMPVEHREQKTLWTLHKEGRTAKCIAFTDDRFRFELRLVIGDKTFSQKCGTLQDTALTLSDWKAALIDKGWES